MKISFIIIGRNEGWKLAKCLDSVFKTIEYNNLYPHDVIYVDSKSIDSSIEIAKSYRSVNIFQLKGEVNAAIARNIGARNANGEILFFIDGDMEIEPSFLSLLNFDTIDYDTYCYTGHINDYCYSYSDSLLEIKARTYTIKVPNKEQILTVTGGIFIICKNNWNRVCGMRSKYRRSQDIDLFLRLDKIGINIIRLPGLIAKHHTIDYRNNDRMWIDLKKGNAFYDSLIFRDHLLSLASWKRTIRSKYTSFILLFSCMMLLFDLKLFIYILSIYLFIVTVRVFINTISTNISSNKLIYYLKRLAYCFIIDVLFWVGMAFFFPKRKKKYKLCL